MDIIVAENLTKRFGELIAVDGISFAVKEGEMFGFLGPNGAGKTTTMRMIQCVSPKNSGKLLVAGMDVEAEPRKIKNILGVSPQEQNLDPDFTVIENLVIYSRYFGINRGEAESRSDKWLDFFQLQGKKDTLIDKLSGGMKRRLLLARAMLNEPRILILDEPTVGLDPQARHLIWDLLRQLKSQGITVTLTTHYMEEAAQLCDRLVIMDNGKILAEGRPKELVDKHVASNVIETANKPEVMACARKYKQSVQIEAAGDMVHIFTNEPKEILSHLMDECTIESTTVRESTLEDVFLKLTGRMLRE
ncbi:MAG TPA: ABC transporter ATP-binding protein [Thermoplasmata archaeon]|nr:ABC transporter ATP-binding protein [Thermoplasmata archaeon]